MLPFGWARFEFGESVVAVFAIYRFTIGGADAMRAAFGENFGVAGKLHAHHFVDA